MYKNVAFVLMVMIFSRSLFGVHCCGPGLGGGRRRSPRRLTPLVFKQHVPNVMENTLVASGLTRGRIQRNSSSFRKELVPNYNADIIFKDEEGTGADRLMTERCRERVNTLAISVMNHWPGVRLRVTEAWDEEGHHAPHSLHYEGRAVDITTSDKDRRKNGMLARLAVEAGFDWVYYEARSHVHCSVKSEHKSRREWGGCFPGASVVRTPAGFLPLNLLQEGDLVQVLTAEGLLDYSPVLLFLHQDPSHKYPFLSVTTSSLTNLSLTPSHLLFVLRQDDISAVHPSISSALEQGTIQLAGKLRGGDYVLVTQENSSLAVERVVGVTRTEKKGVFAPLTAEGTVVVDGVVASCYAVIDSQWMAHAAFVPLRMAMSLRDGVVAALQGLGVVTPQHHKVVKKVSNHIYDVSLLQEVSNHIDVALYDYEDLTTAVVDDEPHVHWYPRILYTIAAILLPNHWMA